MVAHTTLASGGNLPITERLRPKSMGEYFGSENLSLARNFLEAWMQGRPLSKFMVLHGPPGLGKTTLVRLLAANYNIPLVEVNGSDSRKVADLKRLWDEAVTTSLLLGGKKLIVVDEADSLPVASFNLLSKIVLHTHNPVVLICNDLYSLPREFRFETWAIGFQPPTNDMLLAFGRHIGLAPECNSAIAPYARSYRGMVILSDIWQRTGEVGVEVWQDLSDRDAVSLFTKDFDFELDMDPYTLLGWLYDSSSNFACLDVANALLNRVREVGYGYWFYVYVLLRLCSVEKVEYPRTFRLMGERKERKQAAREEKTTERRIEPSTSKEAVLSDWW